MGMSLPTDRNLYSVLRVALSHLERDATFPADPGLEVLKRALRLRIRDLELDMELVAALSRSAVDRTPQEEA